MKTSELFDLNQTLAKPLLSECEYPWQVLGGIKDFILTLGETLDTGLYEKRGDNVWIAKSAKVFESAYIEGPCIIGEGSEIRQCAFIRGSVLVGENCVIGNSTEVKNSIIFNNVQIPHFNYVGDSVLGYKSHLGAGAVTSNVKSDKSPVTVKTEEAVIETGLKKFGAMVGDYTEVGCHSVLCPGTILGKNCTVYPTSMVRGFVKANSIFKSQENIVTKI